MASRFWVGGTGTWDASDTTHWAATSGGAGGQSVPGSADAVTFDGNSGGGTVTPNFGGTISVQSITMGSFTGTLDFSVNNNDVTLQTFSGTGSAVRTLRMGNGTWTVQGTSWNLLTTTNLTFNANSSSLVFTGTSTGGVTFSGGSVTYNIVTVSVSASSSFLFNSSTTMTTLNISSGCLVSFSFSNTFTISTLNVTGTNASPATLKCSSDSNTATLSVASNPPSISWAAMRAMVCSGGATFAATNSFDLGRNSGITIAPPSVGGSFGVIGS